MTAPSVASRFALTEPGSEHVLADPVDRCTEAGILDLIRPDRRHVLDTFARDYAAVRTAEERELTPDEVRALPRVRPDHPLADMWDQRHASAERFDREMEHYEAGTVVDIGAGCAWLAARMTRRGWHAAAVDVTVHGGDGLAAARHHGVDMMLIRAEMQALPFARSSVDAAVFNASLHYASSVRDALAEAARVVRPGGVLVVLDSPIYRDRAAGEAMVREFGEFVQQTYGISPAAHEGPGFIHEPDLDGFQFSRIEAASGLRRRVQQWRGARRAGRETASRPMLLTTIGSAA